LLDNHEWGSYVPKFGLVSVDRETFGRTPKPSASFYRDVIHANGLRQEDMRRYLRALPTLDRGVR